MKFINQLFANLKKVYSSSRNNICGIDLADMQSLSKCNKRNKYAWIVPIKDKKGTSIVNVFTKIISKGRKPNKYCLIKVVSFIIILSKIF